MTVERPPKLSRPQLPRCGAIIENFSGELKAARDANDTLREQVATSQAESAALKGKTEALEAALDREVADRRTLQQQIDHVRRECQAAQERVVQAKA
jgi:chromosome segregation ATPase